MGASERVTFQVGAGAKSAALTGDDPNPEGRFRVKPIPNRVQFVVSGRVDAVEGSRTRQRYEENVSGWERKLRERCRGRRDCKFESGSGHNRSLYGIELREKYSRSSL